MSCNDWIEYWNTNNIWSGSAFWRKNAEIFVKSTQAILNYGPNDSLLDIGCGSGTIAELLHRKVNRLVCVDTSVNYVNSCKKKFKHDASVECYPLPHDYTHISFLKQKFSIMIAVSVIQYYQKPTDVLKLVEEAKKIAMAGAKLLIADIPYDNKNTINSMINVMRFIISSIKGRYYHEAFDILCTLYLKDRAYRKTSKDNPVTKIPIRKILQAVECDLGLKAEIIERQLTVNVDRKHLLVHF